MIEYQMLQTQLTKCKRSMSPELQKIAVDGVALWGNRLYQVTQELAGKLQKQLEWLEGNACSNLVEQRTDEWLESLHEYERACALLRDAEEVL